MHHEDGRVRSSCVNLIERRNSPFGELEFIPTSDDPHPLRRWSSCSLVFQHAQCIGQRRDTVPTQLQVVVESAPDRMHVRIVETRDNSSSTPVNYAPLRTAQAQNLLIGAS